MFLRQEPTLTLDDVFTTLDVPTAEVLVTSGRALTIHGDGSSLLATPEEGERVEIPLDDEGWSQIGGLVQIPEAFAKRLPTSVRVNLTNDLLQRHAKGSRLRYTAEEAPGGSHLVSLLDPGQIAFEPRRVVEVAQRVIGERAPVVWVGHSLTDFSFDVTARQGEHDLGDPRVGDITRAGLRFAQNLRQNLAPTVSPYSYRLICTNGMEVQDNINAYKVDGRGQSVDEVMAELEIQAQRAFAAVEANVEHFYAMREERVAHPERTLNRMATEFGLSDRVRHHLIDAVPTVVDDQGVATMFDLVNLATNMANQEGVTRGTRVSLERFGGRAVASHVERCRSCASRII